MHDESLWLEIAWLCLLISLMAIGGANAMVPEIHRYVIEKRGWMRGDEFAALFAIAQASPGPNVLFIAVLGWNFGLNAATAAAPLAQAAAQGVGRDGGHGGCVGQGHGGRGRVGWPAASSVPARRPVQSLSRTGRFSR